LKIQFIATALIFVGSPVALGLSYDCEVGLGDTHNGRTIGHLEIDMTKSENKEIVIDAQGDYAECSSYAPNSVLTCAFGRGQTRLQITPSTNPKSMAMVRQKNLVTGQVTVVPWLEVVGGSPEKVTLLMPTADDLAFYAIMCTRQ
jgi:hypothetical protein